MKIYLAGPMRGIPQFNFPAFFHAARQLKKQGHVVFNPAERDMSQYGEAVCHTATGDVRDVAHLGITARECFAADTAWICEHAEAIALLPRWSQSRGARAEKALAEALDLNVIYLEGAEQ